MMPSDPLPAAGRNWNVGTGRVTWLPKAGTAVRERPTLVKERNRRIREYNSTSGECGNSRLAGESVLRLSWVLGSGAGP